MKTDTYGCVYNDPETYLDLAMGIQIRPILLAWTDRQSTLHDILMALNPMRVGPLQSFGPMSGLLFVSVLKRGSFGFSIGVFEPLHPHYIGEKMSMSHECSTTQALAELITGVRDCVRGLGS